MNTLRNAPLRWFVFLVTLSLSSCADENTKPSTDATTLTSNISTTAGPQTNDTYTHKVRDVLCINNYGECVSVNGTCEHKRAIVTGICDKSDQICCVPSQDEQTDWGSRDEECLRQFGECKLDTKSCQGSYGQFECGGPSHRKCCIPDAKDMSKWEEGDTICKNSLGSCQLYLKACAGQYQADTCGGPKQRQCCLPGEKVRAEWEEHDGKCHDVWGECLTPDKKCSGKQDKTLCGGPDGRQCCIPDKATIKGWDDKACLLAYGSCEQSTYNCTGSLEDKCGGPSYRKCCAPDPKKINEWKKGDALCTKKGGICQSIAIKCNEKYLEGFCDGPAQVRQCCLKPAKKDDKVVSSPTGGGKETDQSQENDSDSTTGSVMDKILANRSLVLGVSIPALIILLALLICLIKKQSKCCRPYKKLRGDPKKTPWYKMEYGEMDDDEDVNLTMGEESKTYA